MRKRLTGITLAAVLISMFVFTGAVFAQAEIPPEVPADVDPISVEPLFLNHDDHVAALVELTGLTAEEIEARPGSRRHRVRHSHVDECSAGRLPCHLADGQQRHGAGRRDLRWYLRWHCNPTPDPAPNPVTDQSTGWLLPVSGLCSPEPERDL